MKITFVLLTTLLFISVFVSCKNKDDYRELGHKAFDKNDFKSAFKYYSKAAEMGDPISQYFLAGLYERGLGCKQDTKQAIGLYSQSSKAGYELADYCLGMIYYKGKNVQQDYFLARKYFERSSKAVKPQSLFMLGKIYMRGEGIEPNYRLALEYFIQALKYEDKSSYEEIVRMYENGLVTSDDLLHAIELLKKNEINSKYREKLQTLIKEQKGEKN